jgi:hypothetical protein
MLPFFVCASVCLAKLQLCFFLLFGSSKEMGQGEERI